MCGFAGFLDRRGIGAESGERILRAMTDAIAHRGPDDSDTWIDPDAGIALGHRRLAIIDLSPGGRQPMQSVDGRWMIVFNGEIYNFERIRAALESSGQAPDWHGHSDTEVLLAAISAWGVERALQSTIGMFAFALWDRRECHLYLARDRAGEKPLYYGQCGNTLLFGSELKSLRLHPSFEPELSKPAMAAFLRFGYVPSPLSIHARIRKLEPGCYTIIDSKDLGGAVTRYWTPPIPETDPALASFEDASRAVEELLTDAVALQMRADVPMGAFLSGGVDSSTIVALMQRQSSRPIRTFSIGFREAEFNEAQHAAEVARYLKTDHHELYVTAQDALDVVPQLPLAYDEPFADSSQIPTLLLSKLTREHVTVALSGDAGDELFGGYTRYFQGQQFARFWSTMPVAARRALSRTLCSTPPHVWTMLNKVLPARLKGILTADRLPKIGAALACDDIYAVYRRLVSQWPEPERVALFRAEPATWMTDRSLRLAVPDITQWMMAVDFRSYLPDDILVKVDRASMAASLETRVPLLDHRVIELAARIPITHNVSGGHGKRVLRSVLYRHVPKSLIERPKQGFGVPIGAWLRGPLRDWAEELLRPDVLAQGGLLDPQPIRAAWQRHLSGRENLQYPLWTVLMFQAWQRSAASA